MTNELQHHGILGMKWGVRRYQNKDGTLTEAGRKRIDKKMNSGNVNDKNHVNRKKADDNYTNWFKNELKKANNGKDFDGDGSEASDLINKAHKDNFYTDRLYNTYIKEKAEATIKDLNINTYAAEKYIRDKYDEQLIDVYSFKFDNHREEIGLSKSQANDDEFKRTYNDLKFERKLQNSYVHDVIKQDGKNISKQIVNEMISDINRWSKEEPGYYQKLTDSDIKRMNKQVLENLDMNSYRKHDGTIDFTVCSEKYADGSPLTVIYDPKRKKITDIYWT